MKRPPEVQVAVLAAGDGNEPKTSGEPLAAEVRMTITQYSPGSPVIQAEVAIEDGRVAIHVRDHGLGVPHGCCIVQR